MKRPEVFLWLLIILSLVLDIIDIKGCRLLMYISFFGLSLYYLVFGIIRFNNTSFKKLPNRKNVAIAFILGMSLSLLLIGILFKIIFIENSEYFLIIGTVLIVILYIKYSKGNKILTTKHNIIPVLILSLFSIFFLFFPKQSLAEFYVRKQENKIVPINVIIDTEFKYSKTQKLVDKAKEYNLAKEFNLAKNSLMEALILEPNSYLILNNLGIIEMNNKNFKDSKILFKKATKFTKKDMSAYINLSLVYYYTESYKKSIRTADYVINHTNDSIFLTTAYLHSCFSNIKLKNCIEAKDDFNLYIKYSKKDVRFDSQTKEAEQRLDACE